MYGPTSRYREEDLDNVGEDVQSIAAASVCDYWRIGNHGVDSRNEGGDALVDFSENNSLKTGIHSLTKRAPNMEAEIF